MKRWVTVRPRDPREPPTVTRFDVPADFRGVPGCRFDMAVRKFGSGWNYFIGGRVVVADTTRAWFQIDDWWSRRTFAVAPDVSSPLVVRHIRSQDVEPDQDWCDWFLRELIESERSPLYPAGWMLGTLEMGPPYGAEKWKPPRAAEVVPAPWPRVFDWSIDGAIVPLRPASPGDSGRVTWWRKLARRGSLPPILLYYCRTLYSWVVIDGHDRLLAAALENVQPRYVGLLSVRTSQFTPVEENTRQVAETALRRQLVQKPQDPRTIDAVNQALIALWNDEYVEFTGRAWPIEGGADAWKSELETRAVAGGERERELLDAMAWEATRD